MTTAAATVTGKNVLVLYNETQTFTSTVFEHLDSLARFSKARVFFAHQDLRTPVEDLSLFDVVIIHYSIRLPFDQIADGTAAALMAFCGLKVVFIQDEYDHTHRAWSWIKRLGVGLVFSSVPDDSMPRIYPPSEFPGVRFVSNLTGYAPEALAAVKEHTPPSQRPLKIGYRGRPLPIRYGALGRDKIEIGRKVKAYCESAGIEHDIAWEEADRLYGNDWYEFIVSCRAVLGNESGSNVFDWDGTLNARIDDYRSQHPAANDDAVYDAVIAPLEMHGLMNQVSSRVFEAIACRTALVLFEGSYSGVVLPDQHFISLKRDCSNLPDVVERLRDGDAMDAMTQRAFDDVLATGKYGYRAFVRMVDDELARAIRTVDAVGQQPADQPLARPHRLTLRTRPYQHRLVRPPVVVPVAQELTPVAPKQTKSYLRRLWRGLVTPSE